MKEFFKEKGGIRVSNWWLLAVFFKIYKAFLLPKAACKKKIVKILFGIFLFGKFSKKGVQ
jgi:hypothetical protein